jgi:CO/xanthine dehydrogenase Mo-binding subunit
MYCMGRQCYFQEVEVDPDTGKVYVKKVVVVNDAGQVICPEAYEGQQMGGTYMGIGRSNTEQLIWDLNEGVKLNDNLIGYDIALINDCGPIECHHIESHLGYTGYGAFGVGESAAANGCSLTRYSVHNAIGKWVDLKTTPDKILKALGKA